MSQLIQNPDLLAAMTQQGTAPSPEGQSALYACLSRATFLAATLNDDGSKTQFVTTEQGGRLYLPLFTDWTALTAYTKREVKGLPLLATDAWDFALRHFDAVVINPANNALPLEKPALEHLQALARGH